MAGISTDSIQLHHSTATCQFSFAAVKHFVHRYVTLPKNGLGRGWRAVDIHSP